MIAMLRLPFVPGTLAWISRRGDARAKLAISDLNSPAVHIYDARSGDAEPIAAVALHKAPVTAMVYIEAADAVVSADGRGFLEYWSGSDYAHPADAVDFRRGARCSGEAVLRRRAERAARSLAPFLLLRSRSPQPQDISHSP